MAKDDGISMGRNGGLIEFWNKWIYEVYALAGEMKERLGNVVETGIGTVTSRELAE